jgi:hypothetical protein
MRQFLAGGLAALLLVAGGLFWWKSLARADSPIAPPPRAAAELVEPLAEPPRASEKTREEKRFSRYDKDKNGAIARDEYMLSRRKAFAKLDTNGDGRLSFEEYAIKTSAKFAHADADRSGVLSPAEFATTRVVRKTPPKPNCPPVRAGAEDEG